ncbi:MAG: adenylate/guanylate cyclase domain-containing protein [Gammaproteobacteria bacterium]|nr:adenylate/guanylate cyclase domain-containing protein [Gammaproteobacteria bacterium]
MLKKFFLHLIINFLIISALIGAYIHLPESYQSIDNRLKDFMFLSRGVREDSDTIRIIAIDEPSLSQLGQWPWEREKIALILQNLTLAGAKIIGMDVFFSEIDKSSPNYVFENLNKSKQITDKDFATIKSLVNLPDYDKTFAEMIANTPTILGYIMDLKDERNLEQFPMINTTISEKNYIGHDFLPVAKGVTLNIERFQDKAFSSGFLNNIPDASGMIRRVPLLIKYQEVVFTSLAMEIYCLLTGIDSINVLYEETGISNLELISGEDSFSIPTDRNGRLFLNFLGPQNSFEYISAKDIFNNNFDKNEIKDKVVLFGATAVGLLDLRASPFDNALPGIEVHATAIENMLFQNYLQSPDWVEGATAVTMLLLAVIFTVLYSFLSASMTVVILLISLVLFYQLMNYMLFQQGIILNILFPLLSIILLTISSTLINYFLANKQRKLIKDKFAQKVSSAVVDDILKNEQSDILIAQEKDVSIFFSDIRGFTQISESLGSPSKLIDLLNVYMTPMVDNIMQQKGTIDKFIGDAVMAYWNAPHEVKNHADMAVQSALAQLKMLDDVNLILQDKYQLTIDIGIGINTGKATVGEMGSRGRSDYTIIGDAVNLASRLEGLNKPYGCHLIISEFTKAQLTDEYIIRQLDKVRVKGKHEGIAIYEVLGRGVAEGQLKHNLDLYYDALALYYEAKFDESLKLFEELLINEQSQLIKIYIDRCTQYINKPPIDFDGVFTHTSK